VSLYDILDTIYMNTSIEEIEDLYPTIPPGKLRQVLEFCSLRPEIMRDFHEEQRRLAESLRSSHKQAGPTREELRERLNER
jgi:hypothetical protein